MPVAALMGLQIFEARMNRPDIDAQGHVLLADSGTEEVTCDERIDDGAYRRLLAVDSGTGPVRRTAAAGTDILPNRSIGR